MNHGRRLEQRFKSVKAVTKKTVYCGDAEKEMKNAMTEDANSY